MKKALVLSGGGARGAYQFGVWKALRKLNEKIDLVTGTSIGALNGCLIVQDDYNKAKKLWTNLSFSDVFDKEFDVDINNINIFKEYISAFLKEGGMEVKNLENTVANAIDTDKFYNSDIDFGLVTFKLNTLKPIMLRKKDINKSELNDYLMASATCYPAFKKREIGNDVYIDGGYYDNLPVNLAIDMGATDIIAVDLNTLGFNRNIKNKDVNIKYIKPRNKMGNFLMFDAKEANRSIRLGYNDTLKEYNKLEGNKYTFKKYHLYFNYILVINNFKRHIMHFNKPKTKLGSFFKKTVYGELDKNNRVYDKKLILDTLEYLGSVFEIDDSYIYGLLHFNNLIIKGLDSTKNISKKQLEADLKTGDVKTLLKRSILIKYIYKHLGRKQDIINIATLFPQEYMAAVYLYTIKKHE